MDKQITAKSTKAELFERIEELEAQMREAGAKHLSTRQALGTAHATIAALNAKLERVSNDTPCFADVIDLARKVSKIEQRSIRVCSS